MANEVVGEPSNIRGDETPRPGFTPAHLIRDPKKQITDPDLYKAGYKSHGKIAATAGKYETLDKGEFAVICV